MLRESGQWQPGHKNYICYRHILTVINEIIWLL